MATTKYHLTARGEPAACHAHERPCPRGGAEDHYPTREAAQEAFEKRQGAGVPAAVRRGQAGIPFDPRDFSAVEERFSKTTLLDTSDNQGFPTVDSNLIAAHSKQEWEQISETLRAKAEETALELREVPSISSTTAGPLVEGYRAADRGYQEVSKRADSRVQARIYTQAERAEHNEALAERQRAREALVGDPAYQAFERKVTAIYARANSYAHASAVARAAAEVADSRVVDGVRVPGGHMLTPALYDLRGGLMGPVPDTSRSSRVMTDSAGEKVKVRLSTRQNREQRIENDLMKGYYVGTGVAPVTLSTSPAAPGLPLPAHEAAPAANLENDWLEADKQAWGGEAPMEVLALDHGVKHEELKKGVRVHARVDAPSVREALKVMKPTGDNRP